ncbi:MAG: YggT family protein [Dehalococcoidia bacterium]
MNGIAIVIALLQVLFFLILARVIMSWIPLFTQKPLPYDNPIVRFVHQVTEPLLSPIRRFAMIGMIDLSPLVLIIVLQVITGALASRA